MIVSANGDTNFAQTLEALGGNNPFACRIISLYNSYSPMLAFVDYWSISDGNSLVGAVARNGTAFILFLTDKCDIDEVSAFMRVAGAASVVCDGKYELDIFCKGIKSGTVFMKSSLSGEDKSCENFIEPNIKAVYNLLVKCADEDFTPPEFKSFYVDVNHRLRHGTMRVCGVKDKNSLVSAAMTVAESKKSAVLGAVACDPNYRRIGFGTKTVNYITDSLIYEGKAVFLHCADNSNTEFYKKLGFTEFGRWKEYYF